MVQWVRESMLEYMLPEKALESTAAVDFIARVSKVSPSSVDTRLLLSSTRASFCPHATRHVVSSWHVVMLSRCLPFLSRCFSFLFLPL
jgi:hypothetical protein